MPVLAVPPVPTLIVKAAEPLLLTTEGLDPKPEIVGAVVFRRRFVVVTAGVVIPVVAVKVVKEPAAGVVLPMAAGAAKVLPPSCEEFKPKVAHS